MRLIIDTRVAESVCQSGALLHVEAGLKMYNYISICADPPFQCSAVRHKTNGGGNGRDKERAD